MGWGGGAQAAHRAGEPRADPRRRARLRRARRSSCARRCSPGPGPGAALAVVRGARRRAPGRTAGWRPSSRRPRSWSSPARCSTPSRPRSGRCADGAGQPRGPRADGTGAVVRRLAAGGRPADADEQPRPRRRRAPGRPRRLRRHRPRGAVVGRRSTRSSARCAPWRPTRRCSCSRASRSASFRTHEWAPRVLIANSNLVPEWATWDEFRRLEALGLTMYGQMTAGSWIYIGSQGIVQGTYECFAEIARRRYGGSLAGHDHADRRPRRDGRRATARGHHERRRRALRRGRPAAHRAPRSRRATSTRSPTTSTTRSPAAAPRRRERRALSVGLCANAADVLPALLALGFDADIVTDQTSAHDPLVGYVPDRMTLDEADALRAADPDEYVSALARRDRRPLRGDGRLPRRGRRGLRLRQQPARRGAPGRLRARLRLPRVRARLHPAAVLRGQGPVPLGGALGRPGRHRRDRPRRARGVPRRRAPRALDPPRRRADRLPGPARADLLAGLRRAPPPRAALQRDGRVRRAAARRSSSAATTSTPARSPRPTARPRGWPTSPTRSPTGRCSTRWSTPRRARRG